MSLKVGRFGIDVPVESVESVTVDGDVVRITGTITATSSGDLEAARRQLLGHVTSRWEPVVPVTWTENAALNGFYRVESGSVSTVPVSLAAKWYPFEVTVRRVAAAPRVESFVTGVARATGQWVVPTFWHGVPDVVKGYRAPESVTTVRRGPGGGVRFYRSSSYSAWNTSWAVTPANWYVGGCWITQGGRHVVGDQILNDPTDWQIGNSCMKVVSDGGNPTVVAPDATETAWGNLSADLVFGWWDGVSFAPVGNPVAIKVVANSTHECGITIRYEVDTGVHHTVPLDVTILVRTGDRMATFAATSPTSMQWGILAPFAATSITGGFRQTSNDVDGNRCVVLCANAHTLLTSDPARLYLTSAGKVLSGAFGHEVGGSSAIDPDRATDLRDQWFAVMSDTPRVVS